MKGMSYVCKCMYVIYHVNFISQIDKVYAFRIQENKERNISTKQDSVGKENVE